MTFENNHKTRGRHRGLLWALLALFGALVIAFVVPRDDAEIAQTEDAPTAPLQLQQAPAQSEADISASETIAQDVDVEKTEDAAQNEETAEHPRPTIDEVRLDAGGVLVVAGRAASGDRVAVLVDGVEIGAGAADSSNAFAAIGFLDPSDTAQVLSLLATNAAGAFASEDEVILAPRAAPPEAPQIAEVEVLRDAPASGPDPAQNNPADVTPDAGEALQTASAADATPDAAAALDQTETAAQAATRQNAAPQSDVAPLSAADNTVARAVLPTAEMLRPTPRDQTPQADDTLANEATDLLPDPAAAEPQTGNVALLKSTREGVRLLEPRLTQPDSLALDTIGYSDSGVVQLSGRASAEAREIRIYLDNRPVAQLPLTERGDWQGDVPDVRTGIYTLRVDAVDADGQVTSRVETPFKREAPAVLAAAGAGQTGAIRAVTVQTGDTLWAIARDRYGEGVFFVRVFDANRAAIRDPDLIYPGQVFDLPDN
ncbi:MAG: LysM peptidoglycan-binding domain-containing protein [Roseobacter sp.]